MRRSASVWGASRGLDLDVTNIKNLELICGPDELREQRIMFDKEKQASDVTLNAAFAEHRKQMHIDNEFVPFVVPALEYDAPKKSSDEGHTHD